MKHLTGLLIVFFFFLVSSAQIPASVNGKYFDYNGIKLYYQDTGKGEPLLLLHHFNSTADSWNPYIDSFTKKFRVVMVDMAGHGRSDIIRPWDVEFRHSEYAKMILALLDHLNIDQTHAIGGSSGGITLFYTNIMQPSRFKNVITIGAQIYYDKRVREWITADGPDSAKADYIPKASKTHGFEKAMLLARQFWNFRNFYGDPSFTPDMLNTITANWLIVHGDNDFIPFDQALEMKKYIPNSRLWIFPNGGHLPYLKPANYLDFTVRSMEFLSGKWNKK